MIAFAYVTFYGLYGYRAGRKPATAPAAALSGGAPAESL
jgi:hypothetical protein